MAIKFPQIIHLYKEVRKREREKGWLFAVSLIGQRDPFLYVFSVEPYDVDIINKFGCLWWRHISMSFVICLRFHNWPASQFHTNQNVVRPWSHIWLCYFE